MDDVLEYSVHAQDLRDSKYFEGLGSLWTIRPAQEGEGSSVEFQLWYKVKEQGWVSGLVGGLGIDAMMSSIVGLISQQQMEAFELRARGV